MARLLSPARLILEPTLRVLLGRQLVLKPFQDLVFGETLRPHQQLI